MFFKQEGDDNTVYKMLSTDTEKGVSWMEVHQYIDSDGSKMVAVKLIQKPPGVVPYAGDDIGITAKSFDEFMADAIAHAYLILRNKDQPKGQLISNERLAELESAENELRLIKENSQWTK